MKWNERKAKDAIAVFSFGPEEIVAASEVFRSEMEKEGSGFSVDDLSPATPFSMMVGIVFPLGLLFELRAWLFTRKLKRQMVKTTQTAENLIEYMTNNK